MASPEYFERKSDVVSLKAKLREAVIKKDSKLCLVIIKQTIQLMTQGIDVSSICPEIIMASATNDIVRKKLVYLYLCTCAESNSELALLAINTLVKDALTDNNSIIRGLALRSMLNLRIQSLLQYAKIPLQSGLKDKNSYVRRNAVMASVKLFTLSPEMFKEMDLLGPLHNMIQDSDCQVSCNALIAVNEVEHMNGGIKLDRKLLKYLLGRLSSYNEFSQCILLQIIGKYQTDDEDEVLEYLNYLDDRLKHTNKAIVMAAINLFLHFTKNVDWIKKDVYERIRTSMLSILPSSSPEIVYPILSHVSVLIKLSSRLFHKDYKYFFIRSNDPSYIRLKKLEILTEVVTEGNIQNITDEIREYVHDPDMTISCRAIQSIGKIALENYFGSDTCVNSLIDILHLEVDYITAETLQTLQELMIKYPSVSSYVLPEINNCWEQVQYHAVGKSAIVWIYGEYGQDIPAAPYHLEEVVNTISEEQSHSVKVYLLTAMMKLFFKRPPECQHALGRLLQYCIDNEPNRDIRDRALFYYRLLRTDIEEAHAVLQSSNESLPLQSSVQRSCLANDDFHLSEFNSLSIAYDQPASSFIMQDKVITEDLVPDNQEKISSENDPVAVADLLDMNEEKSALLEKGFTMNKNDFSTAWKTMPHSLEFEEMLTVLPQYDEIVNVMESIHIQLMASSRPEDSPWKFFLYAKMVKNAAVVLMELVVHYKADRMTVRTKSHDGDVLKSFNRLYRDVFVGKWIDLPNR